MPYSVDRYRSNAFSGQPGWPLSINDGNIVSNITSLKLLGRGVPNYGEFIAENFVHLLENFAGLQPPDTPLTGQLWYEIDPSTKGNGILKVFDGNSFVPVASAESGDTFPTITTNGRIHIKNGKPYIFTINRWVPLYQYSQGKNDPSNPTNDNNIGDFYYSTDNDELSILVYDNGKMWRRVLSVDPNNSNAGQSLNIGVASEFYLFKSVQIFDESSGNPGPEILKNNINVITNRDVAERGVKFHIDTPIGSEITVINRTPHLLKVYPQDGGTIDKLLPNASFSLGESSRVVFIKISSSEYITMTAING